MNAPTRDFFFGVGCVGSAVSEASAARILDGYLSAGAPLAVLPETRGDGYFLGHTANFLEVRVEAKEGDLPTDGDILTVLPIRREGEVLICRPLPTP